MMADKKCYECGKPATKHLSARFDPWDLFHEVYFCDACYGKKVEDLYEGCPVLFSEEDCEHMDCYKGCPKRVQDD